MRFMPAKKQTLKFKAGLIRIYRQRIRDLEKEQDKIFSQALRHFHVKDKWGTQATTLFDYMYNSSKDTPMQIARQVWPVTDVVKPSTTKVEPSQDQPTTVSATTACTELSKLDPAILKTSHKSTRVSRSTAYGSQRSSLKK